MMPAAFDFRRPPPGDLERQAGGWLALACRRAAGVWARALAYPVEPLPGPVETVPAAVALQGLTDDTLGLMISPPDPADGTIILAVRRPLLLALLAGLLGETPAALPADRDPTDLEASLVGYLVRELVLDPLERGWPGADPIKLVAGPPGPPRAAQRGPGTDMVLLATLTVAAPFGDYPIHLIMSRTGRWDRLAQPAPREAPADPGSRKQIETLVGEMTVDLAVVLGTADLTMADVARLKRGDVVVLRQKVTDPLDGLVAGARKFRVWPGAVGTRAAVAIHTPTDD
ncbi:MAG: flagellar motor switch protein FliM [Gemmataceae bacterium]|nr:flagellar motor switch protein FliM [Gemmataceae bacterium]